MTVKMERKKKKDSLAWALHPRPQSLQPQEELALRRSLAIQVHVKLLHVDIVKGVAAVVEIVPGQLDVLTKDGLRNVSGVPSERTHCAEGDEEQDTVECDRSEDELERNDSELDRDDLDGQVGAGRLEGGMNDAERDDDRVEGALDEVEIAASNDENISKDALLLVVKDGWFGGVHDVEDGRIDDGVGRLADKKGQVQRGKGRVGEGKVVIRCV